MKGIQIGSRWPNYPYFLIAWFYTERNQRKLLKLINPFCKVAGWINIKINGIFFILKVKLLRKQSYSPSLKKNPRIKLNQEVSYLCTENSKTLMKEFEKNITKKWKYSLQIDLQIQCNSYQNTKTLSAEIEKDTLKVYMK
jgi:hypothetical protein